MQAVYMVTFIHMVGFLFFFFSDDLLDDSDSEEHSRSESVTGRLYLIHVLCRGQEGNCCS